MKTFHWSSKFAYAVGLITTDGNLSKDGRHIELTSKDLEQLKNFQSCLGLNAKVGWKTSGFTNKKYPRIQVGNVKLYKKLLRIGLKPNKTKTLGSLYVPEKYFFDFLRGHFDGDGSIYCYFDPRWRNSFMFYITFISSSKEHLIWLQDMITKLLSVKSNVSDLAAGTYKLRFAKKGSEKIILAMYNGKNIYYLKRKFNKIIKILRTNARVRELADRTA